MSYKLLVSKGNYVTFDIDRINSNDTDVQRFKHLQNLVDNMGINHPRRSEIVHKKYETRCKLEQKLRKEGAII